MLLLNLFTSLSMISKSFGIKLEQLLHYIDRECHGFYEPTQAEAIGCYGHGCSMKICAHTEPASAVQVAWAHHRHTSHVVFLSFFFLLLLFLDIHGHTSL